MHLACHATCGLPDGINDVEHLPPALQGLAPTCSIFCQLCSVNKVVGVGSKGKEVERMERLWKKKLVKLQQEANAYKVGQRSAPNAVTTSNILSMRGSF